MNLLRALATVSGMTLLSRILGFVRDFIIARVFGAGMMTDAFFVAFSSEVRFATSSSSCSYPLASTPRSGVIP